MKRKKLTHDHYVLIAFATVLFWRATWNMLDRIIGNNDSFFFDVLTGAFGLILLWHLTRSFEHLD